MTRHTGTSSNSLITIAGLTDVAGLLDQFAVKDDTGLAMAKYV